MKKLFNNSIKYLIAALVFFIKLQATDISKENLDVKYHIYVQAHQDDWQFFHGDAGYCDVNNPKNKVIFIYTTAGDGGCDQSFWTLREKAALSSIQVIHPDQPMSDAKTALFNGHSIVQYDCGNTTSYFMRLPDGNGCSQGFSRTNHQSLQKLYKREISQITAIDNSTTYKDWNDFQKTLSEIVATVPSFSGHWIHTSDDNLKDNLNDHPDHHYTSLAALQISGYHQRLYLTYCIQDMKPNLIENFYDSKEKIYKEGYLRTLRPELKKSSDQNNGSNNSGDEYISTEDSCNRAWKRWGEKSYSRDVTSASQPTHEMDANSKKASLSGH